MAPPPPPHPAPSSSPPHGARQPPTHYVPPPPHNHAQIYGAPQWGPPLVHSNMYMGQVAANMHGYMNQYYQPHQHQYVPHQQAEQRGNMGREGNSGGGAGRGRRGGPNKRVPSPSPPQAQAPPYIYYPQYYQTQAAQGAPLYHMPMYPPYAVHSYQYAPYVEYPIMEDPSGGEKPPEEYHNEMIMEHEHMSHEPYYPPPHQCLPPPPPNMYDPNRPEVPMEPYTTTYYPVPPPQQLSTPHQFNVHAKNFVRQSDHKNYNNDTKPQETSTGNNHVMTTPIVITTSSVESLPMKDLNISSNKPPSSPPVAAKPNIPNSQQIPNIDKAAPKPPTETPKQQTACSTTNSSSKPEPAKSNSPNPQVTPVQTPTTKSPTSNTPAVPSKPSKSPVLSPLPSAQLKTPVSQPSTIVVSQQQTIPAKSPFTSKKEVPNVKTPEASTQAAQVNDVETVSVNCVTNAETKPVTQLSSVKTGPPVTIAPTPIISKAPFSHAKKPSIVETTPAIAAPQPVAPSANDFPPVPAPKRASSEQPLPTTQPSSTAPHNPSPIRSWASLFESKSAPSVGKLVEDPLPSLSPCNGAPSTNTPQPVSSVVNQKPVAKVGPFDASPLQRKGADKPPIGNMSTLSYSEKTSNGPVQKGMKDDANNREWQQSATGTHINDPNSYRRGEFLSKYQLSHHTVSLQPRGLSNRSNYCYINAILQALIACPPFYNMLKDLPYQNKKGKSSTPIIDAMVELIHEFSPLPPGSRPNRAERLNRPEASSESGTIVGGAGPPLEPAPVLRALRDVQNGGDSFRVDGRQEDAEEFLGCLLNGLNDEMLELIKLVEPEDVKDVPVVNGNDAAQESDDDDEWKVMGPKNKGSIERRCLAGRTPLSDIFRGQLRSRLQRVQGTDSTQSETTHCVQPFFTLPLDIENSTTVCEALERVAGKERMEGVRCRERGKPVDAWSQSLLEKLPPALLLHLKCFQCRPHDNTTAKILKTIEYPIDLKIDPKIMSSKMKYSVMQRSYKLFAVVYHEGSELEKGHYLCDAYHAGSGGWLRYDDSVVTAVTENQVLHPKLPRTPYLLLYRRKDTMHSAQRHNSSNNN